MKWHFGISKIANIHVLLAVGITRTARNAMKEKFTGVPYINPLLHGV